MTKVQKNKIVQINEATNAAKDTIDLSLPYVVELTLEGSGVVG